MKRLTAILLSVLFLLIIGGCVLNNEEEPGNSLSYVLRRYVRGDLGLDIHDGEIVEWYDDHGGCHGDGETYVEVHFADAAFEGRLAGRNDWQALPLDPEVEKFIYHYSGPYWASGYVKQQDKWITKPAKIPLIAHGFWCLVDRQPEEARSERVREDEPFSINNRYSYNLTIGLYDADRRILHVIVDDT